MREFKYKIWDIPNKHWCKSPYALTQFGDLLCKNIVFGNMSDFEVCQYTGLKDKNGKEIYEGDIVHITNENDNEYPGFTPWTGTVEYNICYWRVKSIKYNGSESFEEILNHSDRLEIIGNVYENPHLLDNN